MNDQRQKLYDLSNDDIDGGATRETRFRYEPRLKPSPFVLMRRNFINKMMLGLCTASMLVALIPLGMILFYTLQQGISAVNLEFFLHLPKPVGELGGGMANAIVGSITLISIASGFGIPIGILAGVFLAEFGRGWFANIIRFLTEVLSGLPSIIIGIFAYTLLVIPMKSFSAWAGGVALGVLMIPTITKTTEELLKLVPVTLREAGLALGASQWIIIVRVVLGAASKGIITSVMLAVARVAGETAPLLFTALGNRYWHQSLHEPIASLPVQIFSYAISPYDDWRAQAWAGSTVLIGLVFVLSVVVRWATGGGKFSIQP